jgi:hypothetical protein
MQGRCDDFVDPKHAEGKKQTRKWGEKEKTERVLSAFHPRDKRETVPALYKVFDVPQRHNRILPANWFRMAKDVSASTGLLWPPPYKDISERDVSRSLQTVWDYLYTNLEKFKELFYRGEFLKLPDVPKPPGFAQPLPPPVASLSESRHPLSHLSEAMTGSPPPGSHSSGALIESRQPLSAPNESSNCLCLIGSEPPSLFGDPWDLVSYLCNPD